MQEFGKFPKKSERPRYMGLYEFGPFCLNPLKRIVLRDGEPLPLTPKCFDLLLALVEHPGEVLVKEELMESVWPDTVVEEGNLNRNISTLRKALGESPNDHRYIVTVPGRGYRFVAIVREVPDDHPMVSRHAPQGAVIGESLEFPHEPFARKATVQLLPVPSPSIVRSQFPQRFSGLRRPIIWVAAGAVACSLALVIVFRVGFRTKPVLSPTDQVLIADFSNTTGDAVFDDTLKQAVSVQLTQSPYLNILSDARVRSMLKLMTKPPDTKITADIARDLCQRAGARAYIAGSIKNLGTQYVIGLSAIECRSGDPIALEQEAAQSKEQVLNALDAATTKLRGKLGESLSTMERFDASLVQATTSSLEALQAFSQGDMARDRKGDAAAVPFFKRAIELDPNFALAYDALGITYSNLDEPGLAGENITKAYALRGRTSEREKFEIATNYSQIATGELEKANQIAEQWAQAYPRDSYPHNILGVNYEFLGQYEKAVAEMSEAARLNPDGWFCFPT
jgi:eukaryotic-like serine/threonine-protein kinase